MDSLSLRLKDLKIKSSEDRSKTAELIKQDPFLKAKREIIAQIEFKIVSRTQLLRNVPTFSSFPPDFIESSVRLLEELDCKCGDVIFHQGDNGDSLYIVESGTVSVRKVTDIFDQTVQSTEVAQLGPGTYFGEVSLLTEEVRSATIVAISPKVVCLKMTKATFMFVNEQAKKRSTITSDAIGRKAIENCSIFATLSFDLKKKLVESMTQTKYSISAVICREGTVGNTFYILTEGECEVTQKVDAEGRVKRTIGRLYAGDFFGELALIDATNKRIATVTAMTEVTCMAISRTDFNELFKDMKDLFSRSKSSRNMNKDDFDDGKLKHKRRISALDDAGELSDARIRNYLRRLSKFQTEALWNSLYHRMYRSMMLNNLRIQDYGEIAADVMRENWMGRSFAVPAIIATAQKLLAMDGHRRSLAEHLFVHGLLLQRNSLKDTLCADWPPYQYDDLCKKVHLLRVAATKDIFAVDTRGTTAFLILRGAVRTFSKSFESGPNMRRGGLLGTLSGNSSKPMQHVEDLFPGELVGETALAGLSTRLLTARAITDCDLAVIECEDFDSAGVSATHILTPDEILEFLVKVPVFKSSSHRLLNLIANNMTQHMHVKGTPLRRRGDIGEDLCFVLNGHVELVLRSNGAEYPVTRIPAHEYFGEVALINRKLKTKKKKYESFDIICSSRVEVLSLHESHFRLIDSEALRMIMSAYDAKREWRRERLTHVVSEKARVDMKNSLSLLNKAERAERRGRSTSRRGNGEAEDDGDAGEMKEDGNITGEDNRRYGSGSHSSVFTSSASQVLGEGSVTGFSMMDSFSVARDQSVSPSNSPPSRSPVRGAMLSVQSMLGGSLSVGSFWDPKPVGGALSIGWQEDDDDDDDNNAHQHLQQYQHAGSGFDSLRRSRSPSVFTQRDTARATASLSASPSRSRSPSRILPSAGGRSLQRMLSSTFSFEVVSGGNDSVYSNTASVTSIYGGEGRGIGSGVGVGNDASIGSNIGSGVGAVTSVSRLQRQQSGLPLSSSFERPMSAPHVGSADHFNGSAEKSAAHVRSATAAVDEQNILFRPDVTGSSGKSLSASASLPSIGGGEQRVAGSSAGPGGPGGSCQSSVGQGLFKVASRDLSSSVVIGTHALSSGVHSGLSVSAESSSSSIRGSNPATIESEMMGAQRTGTSSWAQCPTGGVSGGSVPRPHSAIPSLSSQQANRPLPLPTRKQPLPASKGPHLHRMNDLAINVNPLMALSIVKSDRQTKKLYDSINTARKLEVLQKCRVKIEQQLQHPGFSGGAKDKMRDKVFGDSLTQPSNVTQFSVSSSTSTDAPSMGFRLSRASKPSEMVMGRTKILSDNKYEDTHHQTQTMTDSLASSARSLSPPPFGHDAFVAPLSSGAGGLGAVVTETVSATPLSVMSTNLSTGGLRGSSLFPNSISFGDFDRRTSMVQRPG